MLSPAMLGTVRHAWQAWKGKAWRGPVRRGAAGKDRRGYAWTGTVRHCRHGLARHGGAMLNQAGDERQGTDMQGTVRSGFAGRCRQKGSAGDPQNPPYSISFPSGRDRSREDSAVLTASQPPERGRSAAGRTNFAVAAPRGPYIPEAKRRIQSATDIASPCRF